MLDEIVNYVDWSHFSTYPNTLGDLFRHAYNILQERRPSEYIYKNALIKRLQGVHNASPNDLFTELRIGQRKADLAFLGEELTAFEIKTDQDSLRRIHDQVLNYQSAFERIYIVSATKHIDRLLHDLDPNVGIIEFRPGANLIYRRDAKADRSQVKNSLLFDSLRQPEYLYAIMEHYGHIPSLPNTEIYRYCKEKFSELSPDRCCSLFKSAIRRFRSNCGNWSDMESFPSELNALMIANKDLTNYIKRVNEIYTYTVSANSH